MQISVPIPPAPIISVLDADVGYATVSGFSHRSDHLLVVRTGTGVHPKDRSWIAHNRIIELMP